MRKRDRESGGHERNERRSAWIGGRRVCKWKSDERGARQRRQRQSKLRERGEEKETKRLGRLYIYMALYVGGVIWGNDKQLQRLCLMVDTRLEATNIEVGVVVTATTKERADQVNIDR